MEDRSTEVGIDPDKIARDKHEGGVPAGQGKRSGIQRVMHTPRRPAVIGAIPREGGPDRRGNVFLRNPYRERRSSSADAMPDEAEEQDPSKKPMKHRHAPASDQYLR